MGPRAVLMKSGLVSVNIARQVNAAHSKTTVNDARPMSYLSKKAYSTVKRPILKNTTFKNSNFNQRVNTVKGKNVNTVRPKAVVNTARPKAVVNVVKGNNVNVVKASACWVWKPKTKGNPQMDLQDKGVIDSGCSRHMIVNMSYLTNYEEIDVGYVAFGGNPKGGKITRKYTIKTDHLGKFDGKADEGFFVGYSLNSKAFRVFNSRTRIVEENLHIRFNESTPNVVGSGPDWLFDIDALTRTMNYEPIIAGTQSNGFAGTKASDNAGQARKETEPVKDYILLPLWTADPPYSQDPKSSHDDGSKPSSGDRKKVDEDPRKESECNDQEKEDNVNSIELLFDLNMPALEDVSIFDYSRDNEDDAAVLGDKNLEFNNNPTTQSKKDVKENREHGFWLEEGIDYDEVFAPIVRIEAIRLFLAYASFKDFVVYQMDVKSAFLYGKIEEEVYVCRPPGFEDPYFPDRVYKVEKVLYGLHQAPRAWCETLSTYLLDNGFQRGKINKTLFIKRHKGDILLVQVYMDDIIFGLIKKELCNAFEKLMHEKF
ncbi:putative ribonuclease H-like domain-containing protein [Tanacetum coccineum]